MQHMKFSFEPTTYPLDHVARATIGRVIALLKDEGNASSEILNKHNRCHPVNTYGLHLMSASTSVFID